MFLVVSGGALVWLVHAPGACLLPGRASHPYGVSRSRENHTWRMAGVAMTFTPILVSALYLLVAYAVRAQILNLDRES